MDYTDSEHPQGSSVAQLFPGQLRLLGLYWQAPHPPCQEQDFQWRKWFMSSEHKGNPTDWRKYLSIYIGVHAYLTVHRLHCNQILQMNKNTPNQVELTSGGMPQVWHVIISETSSLTWLKTQCQLNLGLIQQKITTAFAGYRHTGFEWLHCVNVTHNSEISTCCTKKNK